MVYLRDDIQLSTQDIASLVRRVNLARTDEIADKTHLVRGPPGVPGLAGINGRDGVPGSPGQTGAKVVFLLQPRAPLYPPHPNAHGANAATPSQDRASDLRAACPPSRRRALGGRLARPGPWASPARSARRAQGEPIRLAMQPGHAAADCPPHGARWCGGGSSVDPSRVTGCPWLFARGCPAPYPRRAAPRA